MNVAEFDDLKDLLDLTKASLDDYPALALIIELTQFNFEEYLGRELDYKKRTETFRVVNPTSMIPLVGLPVKSVSSFTWEENAVTDYNTTDFGLDVGSKVKSGTFVVVYKGGLSTVPGWLRRAGIMQVAYEYQNKDHIGADYVQTEGGSVGRPALQLLPDVKRMLDRHRHALTRLF